MQTLFTVWAAAYNAQCVPFKFPARSWLCLNPNVPVLCPIGHAYTWAWGAVATCCHIYKDVTALGSTYMHKSLLASANMPFSSDPDPVLQLYGLCELWHSSGFHIASVAWQLINPCSEQHKATDSDVSRSARGYASVLSCPCAWRSSLLQQVLSRSISFLLSNVELDACNRTTCR